MRMADKVLCLQHFGKAWHRLSLHHVHRNLRLQRQHTRHIDELAVGRLPNVDVGLHLPVVIHSAVTFQLVQERRYLLAVNFQVRGLRQVRLHDDEYQVGLGGSYGRGRCSFGIVGVGLLYFRYLRLIQHHVPTEEVLMTDNGSSHKSAAEQHIVGCLVELHPNGREPGERYLKRGVTEQP